MKTTKQQLRQIIKEELEVILTNEEAGELFGEGVEAQLEEQELNEDLGQLPELANMLGTNPEELMIVLKALGLTAANLGGGVGAGLGMSKIIDMIRDYRERNAEPEDEQPLDEGLETFLSHMNPEDLGLIIKVLGQVAYNFSPAAFGTIAYMAARRIAGLDDPWEREQEIKRAAEEYAAKNNP